MWENNEQLIIEQQRNGNGVQSTVQGWMNGGLPTGSEKYTKDGKRIVAEEEWFHENGKWVNIWIYEDQVYEVEDARSRLESEAAFKELKKTTQVVEETVVEEKEIEEEIKGPGMRIMIKVPFRLQRAPPKPGIEWEKKVEEVLGNPPTVWQALVAGALKHGTENKLEDCSLVVDASVVNSDSAIPVALEQVQAGNGDDVDATMVPAGPKEDAVVPVPDGKSKVPTWLGKGMSNGHGGSQGQLAKVVKKELKVTELLEESDSGIENTPTHEIRKLKQTLYGIGREEKQLEKITGEIESFEYQTVNYEYIDVTKNRAQESITRSLDPNYNHGVEEEIKISLGELQGVIPGLVYSKPCYEILRQAQSQAFVSQVTSEAPVYLEAGEGQITIRPVGNVADIPPIKWHQAAVAQTGQPLSTANSSVVKSEMAYHKGKQEETFVLAEEVKEDIEKLWYSKAAVELTKKLPSVKPEEFQQTSQDPEYCYAKETKRELKMKTILEEIPAFKYQNSPVTKIPKVKFHMVTVDICVPLYRGEEGNVTVTSEQTRNGDPPIPWEKAAVEKTEALSSATVALQKAEAPQYNEGTEHTLEKLQLEKARRPQPPIIERADVDVIKVDKAISVYVSQPAVEQVRLSIHTAVERDLPKWEQCEDVEFEELRTTKATPKVALGQLYTAKGRQPKVDFAEKQSPVILEEVHQVQRPISPPPKGNFKVNEKLLELAHGETEEIPQVVKDSAKVSLVPKAEENKAVVEVTCRQMKKLDLPKLELHEEQEQITVADIDLSPIAISPKPKQLHAEFHEEQEQITVADVNLSPIAISPKSKQLHAEFHEEQEQITVADVNLSPIAISPKPKQLHAEFHEEQEQITVADIDLCPFVISSKPKQLHAEFHEEQEQITVADIDLCPFVISSKPKQLHAEFHDEQEQITVADIDLCPFVISSKPKQLHAEFHEEQEQITVADVNLSPIMSSPKRKQLLAEYHVEETEDYPDYSLSLQAVPRSLLKEEHEDTIQELSDNVLEVPEIRYSDPKKAEIPQMETHVAEKGTADIFKAPKIRHEKEDFEHVRPEESEPLADEVTNTSATSGEVAKETNINMVGLEVISDITPLSPDIAKEFDLPDESYIQVEQAPKTETSVYVPPPELKNSQEAVLLLKEHEIAVVPHKKDTEGKAKVIPVPTQRLEDAQSSKTEILQAQNFAEEHVIDTKQEYIYIIPPSGGEDAQITTLPKSDMDKAHAQTFRMHQFPEEHTMDLKEEVILTIDDPSSLTVSSSILPQQQMDRANAQRYRIQQLASEQVIDVNEQRVIVIEPPDSTTAGTSSLPQIHQRGREEVLRVRKAYVDRIPSSSHHHHGRVIVVDGHPVHRMRPKPTTWAEIPAPLVRHPPRETVVNSSVRNVIGVIPPLATDAARQGSIPAEVLQKVREQRVDSQQAPADERSVHERVEITSVIPPLPADIARKAETPAEVFRRVHSHHVHSHNAYSGEETNLNEVVESQMPLPPLETRTSMWRLVPGHETARARSTSKESHYMPETEVADEPIPPVERTVPAQQVVTSDEFHRADASTLHSSWVPAEIQVVGELDTLMQQGVIRFNPLSQLVENGVDVHDYDEMFMVKQHIGRRRSSSLQYTLNTGKTDDFKVGHIPQVGYPTKQWTSAQQLASKTVEDRGDDDFDYDKLIRMTTGGQHEVTDDQLPKSGWSTIEVTGQDNVAEQQQRSMERIYNRQDSVFIDHSKPQPRIRSDRPPCAFDFNRLIHWTVGERNEVAKLPTHPGANPPHLVPINFAVGKPQPRIRSDRPPFAFDFSRLIHWTVGERNEIAKLPTHPGANPPHLVPINFDKTTTWVVGTDQGNGTAPEKTYVSVAVPVKVRNTYFVEGSDARSDTISDIVKSPEVTVLHDMQDWKTLTRKGGRSVYSAMSNDPQYSSASPLQTFQGYHPPYNGAYQDSRQLKREVSVDSSTSGRVKRRAPQPPVQRTTSPVQHVYTSSPPARPTTLPVSQGDPTGCQG
ncbi:Hypp412 [Branchiostoma lanceolatum]|uniref:Hypp412 protein n=1 Tax=Branchiostoma lanceolatum TaxID=7740 RepID=A0A8J9WD69_BRALA|nr:Hypp412 [Branchiostoma lanceolatum]